MRGWPVFISSTVSRFFLLPIYSLKQRFIGKTISSHCRTLHAWTAGEMGLTMPEGVGMSFGQGNKTVFVIQVRILVCVMM